MDDLEHKILKMTKDWYQIVGMDHHKDRDCHWYINKTWSYGNEPYYSVEHFGYISRVEDKTEYKTYAEAEEALYNMLKRAFSEEARWATGVINDDEGEWDDTQIERARVILKLLQENQCKPNNFSKPN